MSQSCHSGVLYYHYRSSGPASRPTPVVIPRSERHGRTHTYNIHIYTSTPQTHTPNTHKNGRRWRGAERGRERAGAGVFRLRKYRDSGEIIYSGHHLNNDVIKHLSHSVVKDWVIQFWVDGAFYPGTAWVNGLSWHPSPPEGGADSTPPPLLSRKSKSWRDGRGGVGKV